MGVKAGFLPLDINAMSKAYRAAKNRLIVLDWGGTLVAENDKVKTTVYSCELLYITVYYCIYDKASR